MMPWILLRPPGRFVIQGQGSVLQAQRTVELIPAAGRLIGSLRDMGYEFATAVADLVDNSIEAGATMVSIDVEFEGEGSWVRITDDGTGMGPAALREAMRYGSSRAYSDDDLGKFGLGLKVASLSQCRRLSVASRTNRDRAEISGYCWDLEHIERTNRWELIPLFRQPEGPSLHELLRGSSGTVVLWQRLDRILGYRDPGGEPARRRLAAMCRDVEGHLAVVFHRYLSGEVRGRELRILVNGTEIPPWDPFAREERATKRLELVRIQLGRSDVRGLVTLEPFVLPHQSDFSSPDTFRLASGPANWNQQQGFYVYRSHRLIQSGGWCRIRSVDEHTKLARVALRFSPQLDDAFRVNVSKMRVELPHWIRDQIAEAITPVIRIANEAYRRNGGTGRRLRRLVVRPNAPSGRSRVPSSSNLNHAVRALLSVANADERSLIRRVAARLRKSIGTVMQ
jgi:anti-sigma regulatory factor (Ser/Thr protein kinase)